VRRENGANMTFTEWIETYLVLFGHDRFGVWKLTGWAYSLAIWHGTMYQNCSSDKRTSAWPNQLNRSAAAISGVSRGHSRRSGKTRPVL